MGYVKIGNSDSGEPRNYSLPRYLAQRRPGSWINFWRRISRPLEWLAGDFLWYDHWTDTLLGLVIAHNRFHNGKSKEDPPSPRDILLSIQMMLVSDYGVPYQIFRLLRNNADSLKDCLNNENTGVFAFKVNSKEEAEDLQKSINKFVAEMKKRHREKEIVH